MSTAAIAWILPPTHSEWAIATDEGHVGSSHRVGIAAEDEAGLGGKDLPKASVAVPTAPAARSDSPG
jgi:hypothetical protein